MPTGYGPEDDGSKWPEQSQSGSWGGQASDGADAGSPFGGAGWGQTEYGYGRASGYGQQARASGYGRWGNAPAGGNTGYGGYGPQAPLSTGWPGAAGYGYGPQWGARGADWTVPPRRGKSYKTLWITLSVIATLLICACCGSCFAIYKFTQDAVVPIAAAAFCAELRIQDYTTAYRETSRTLQGQLSLSQFTDAARTLDEIEGPIVKCTSASSLSGSRQDANTASVAFLMPRTLSESLQGYVYLTKEGGSWRVDGVDASLLGTSLFAVSTANDYCRALHGAHYASAFDFLGSKLTSTTAVADYVRAAQRRDQVDGTIRVCAVSAIGSPNTNTAAALTLSITRIKLSTKRSALALAVENQTWKISAIGPEQ